jgi:pimeloyl-ACP methyl ester carboxylesterase
MRGVIVSAATTCLLVLSGGAASAENGAEHGFFNASDGTRIHYMEKGEGVPVILIHGYTGSAEGNWFSNGVAEALAVDHRVVAIDCRGHGQSDKPHDPAKYGTDRMVDDVIELLDHLVIERAHFHGYSMGGGITAQLMARIPERMITAGFGGSGIRESDESFAAMVPPDAEGRDPAEDEASSALRSRPTRDGEALAAVREGRRLAPSTAPALDLTRIDFPVIAIVGEYDSPNTRTHRMWRELDDFTMVRLAGKSHLTAIMAGYIPDAYIDSLVRFIDANDP